MDEIDKVSVIFRALPKDGDLNVLNNFELSEEITKRYYSTRKCMSHIIDGIDKISIPFRDARLIALRYEKISANHEDLYLLLREYLRRSKIDCGKTYKRKKKI